MFTTMARSFPLSRSFSPPHTFPTARSHQQMELFDCDGKVVACLISSPWRLRAFACADFDEVPIFYPAEPRDMRAPVEPAAPEPASRRK